MAGSVNKVILVGNLGRDPEVRTMQDGNEMATLSVATSESWKDKGTGEKREKAEWHRVVIFNTYLAGIAQKYLRKGSKIYLEGQLQTRKYTDKAGIERYSTEVVMGNYQGVLTMLDSKSSSDGSGSGSSGGGYGGYDRSESSAPPMAGGGGSGGSSSDDFDDDIPF